MQLAMEISRDGEIDDISVNIQISQKAIDDNFNHKSKNHEIDIIIFFYPIRNSIVPRSLTSILDSEVIRSHNTRIVFSSRHFLGTEPMRHWLDIKDLYYLLKFHQSVPIHHGK